MDPQQHLAAMDLGAFENLISDMMMSSNERYQQAVDAYKVFRQRYPDELALGLANVLQQSTNVEIRYWSSILLELLLKEQIEEPLAENIQNRVKDILFTCVENEGDENIRVSLYDMIATAFSVFGGQHGWSQLCSFIVRGVSGHNDVLPELAMGILCNLLEQSTTVKMRARLAIMLKKLIGTMIAIPLDVPTENMFKDILLRCVEKENERIVTESLCHTIVTGYYVFGGENGWPELFSLIDQYVSGCNDFLQETAMLILANLLEQSTNVKIRATSSILLKGLIGRLIPYGKTFDIPTQNLIKVILLTCVKEEKDRIVRNSLCHTIVMGYTVFHIISTDPITTPLPDLFSFICCCDSTQCVSGHLQEAASLTLGLLKLHMKDYPISLEDYITCLKNADSADVRIVAFGAAISFIQCTPLETTKCWVPARMKVLTEGLNGELEVTTQKALKLLIEWGHEKPPRFDYVDMRDPYFPSAEVWLKFDSVVTSAFKIAELQSLKKEMRHLAIDFFITISETPRGVLLYVSSNRLFRILMLMLLDIENEAASHWADNEDDDTGKSGNYNVVRVFLDRFAINLDGNTDDAQISEALEQYLAASQWQKRVAAIVAVAQISEVYLKVTKINFDELVTKVLDLFQDPHPRVRLAAINATGQLSTKLDPDLQLQYHPRVLGALATAIYDFQYPRVQVHAVSAMVDISKNYPSDILTSYIHETVNTLVKNDLALDQTRSTTSNLLRQFRRTLPAATWAAIWPTVHPNLQMALVLSL